MQDISDSATLAVAAKARALRAKGIDVVAFGAGEPDFDTPAHIKEAAIAALRAGDTKYPSPVSGSTPLREAICEYTRKYCAAEYSPEQVIVVPGGKDGLHLAFMALLNPGDEVLIPVPYWVSYPEQVKMAGGKPVFIQGDAASGGKITPSKLAAAVTPRTRIFVINSPCNPTGTMYSLEELAGLAAVIRGTNVMVFSDEIYHRLNFVGPPTRSFATLEGMYDRTMTFNSASKSFAMTGWRLGYACGPEPVIKAMTTIQSQTTNGPASFIQTAMIAALTGDQTCVEQMRDAYRRRGERMHAGLNEMKGVKCSKPTGAYYCFPDVSGTFAKLGVSDSAGFASAVLEKAHVALVPGNAFGWSTHARLSFATSDAAIDEGIRRLATLLNS